MTASFPSTVKSFTDKVDAVDDVMAADVNSAYAEITAVETELLSLTTIGATSAAVTAGTATNKAITPKSLADAGITAISAASTTSQGIIEIATNAEAIAMADTERAVTPENLKYAYKVPIMGNSGGATIAGGQTRYCGVGAINATESYVYVPVPFACVIRNLYVYSDGSPGAGQTYTATLRKTIANTAITCQIVAGSNAANDTTHSVSFNAGDRWAIMIVSSATAVTTSIAFSFEIDLI